MRNIEILDPRNLVKNREILYRLIIGYAIYKHFNNNYSQEQINNSFQPAYV